MVKIFAKLVGICYNTTMSKKTKRIIAIIGLVFMAIFSVSFVIYLISPSMLNGAFGYLSIFTICMGLLAMIGTKVLKTPEEKAEEAKKREKEILEYLPLEDVNEEENSVLADKCATDGSKFENSINSEDGAKNSDVNEKNSNNGAKSKQNAQVKTDSNAKDGAKNA